MRKSVWRKPTHFSRFSLEIVTVEGSKEFTLEDENGGGVVFTLVDERDSAELVVLGKVRDLVDWMSSKDTFVILQDCALSVRNGSNIFV